jgi:hypothetical protein
MLRSIRMELIKWIGLEWNWKLDNALNLMAKPHNCLSSYCFFNRRFIEFRANFFPFFIQNYLIFFQNLASKALHLNFDLQVSKIRLQQEVLGWALKSINQKTMWHTDSKLLNSINHRKKQEIKIPCIWSKRIEVVQTHCLHIYTSQSCHKLPCRERVVHPAGECFR